MQILLYNLKNISLTLVLTLLQCKDFKLSLWTSWKNRLECLSKPPIWYRWWHRQNVQNEKPVSCHSLRAWTRDELWYRNRIEHRRLLHRDKLDSLCHPKCTPVMNDLGNYIYYFINIMMNKRRKYSSSTKLLCNTAVCPLPTLLARNLLIVIWAWRILTFQDTPLVSIYVWWWNIRVKIVS